jgi:hypothetical protein
MSELASQRKCQKLHLSFVQYFLAGIALVVLRDEVRKRAGHRGAVALGDVAHAGVDGLLRLDQAFLRIGLVVERHDLDLLAENAALGVHLVGEKLEGLVADLADTGATAGQRVDVTDLDGFLRHRGGREQRQCHGCNDCESAHQISPWKFLLAVVETPGFVPIRS